MGYKVTDGYYRGRKDVIGFDGLWQLGGGPSIIVEVKTTDAYRIDLNAIASYRRKLIDSHTIASDNSSILIIVGKKDTGDLEAQIRGSRFAWDIRLISIDALNRLVRLKEEIEDPKIVRQIGEILVPREYTRLDSIIDIVFSTAEDVQKKVEELDEELEEAQQKESKPKFTPSKFHDACIERIKNHLQQTLVKQSRISYATPDGDTKVVCAVSRTYERAPGQRYWFAFHEHQRDYLSDGNHAFMAFGCGSPEKIILIPLPTLLSWLEGLNKSDDRNYWHIDVSEGENSFMLQRKRDFDAIDLRPYLVPMNKS